MKESLVKFLLILVVVLSLLTGGVFLIIPDWFITIAQAESTNVAWLRALGASMVSVQGFGLAITVFRRRDTNPLLGVVALASTIETGALWFSLATGEFGSAATWSVVVPGIIATVISVLLWGAWFSRHKSITLFNEEHGGGQAPPPPDAEGPQGFA